MLHHFAAKSTAFSFIADRDPKKGLGDEQKRTGFCGLIGLGKIRFIQDGGTNFNRNDSAD